MKRKIALAALCLALLSAACSSQPPEIREINKALDRLQHLENGVLVSDGKWEGDLPSDIQNPNTHMTTRFEEKNGYFNIYEESTQSDASDIFCVKTVDGFRYHSQFGGKWEEGVPVDKNFAPFGTSVDDKDVASVTVTQEGDLTVYTIVDSPDRIKRINALESTRIYKTNKDGLVEEQIWRSRSEIPLDPSGEKTVIASVENTIRLMSYNVDIFDPIVAPDPGEIVHHSSGGMQGPFLSSPDD